MKDFFSINSIISNYVFGVEPWQMNMATKEIQVGGGNKVDSDKCPDFLNNENHCAALTECVSENVGPMATYSTSSGFLTIIDYNGEDIAYLHRNYCKSVVGSVLYMLGRMPEQHDVYGGVFIEDYIDLIKDAA